MIQKKKNFNILISWRLLIDNISEYSNILRKNSIKYELIKTSQHLKEKELIKIIHKYDGIICGDDEITKRVIKKAKKLKIISKWGTGIDSIDHLTARKHKIIVKNSPGAFSKSVAQHAVALIFSLLRNIVSNHNDIKEGIWSKKVCQTIEKKTIGIVGYGRIGKEIHRLLSIFDVKFLLNDKKKIKKNTSLNDLLKNSDIIIICCDLNISSKYLIKFKEFSIMKSNAFIINVSRGAIIKNNDLIKALKLKKIAGAGIDVFENEPLKKKNDFLNLQNCVLTSHNAFSCEKLIKQINYKSVMNIIDYFKKINNH